MKTILLIGAGKSSTCLIDYLIKACIHRNWSFFVADGDLELATSKTRRAAHVFPVALDVQNDDQRRALITQADLVISLLPPTLHFLIAKECLSQKKFLLTASYIDENIRKLEPEISRNNLLFLCEMGLDPGIDHMSAMSLIHDIKQKGAVITSFRSHCGGLVAPESDDNSWHYKISWNPRNVVSAGSGGAVYKKNGVINQRSYETLFLNCEEITVPGIGKLAFYPNRDSLSYIPVYDLEEAGTFIRTTLRHPDFCRGWYPVIMAGLTNDVLPLNRATLTYKKWSAPLLSLITPADRPLYDTLGFFDNIAVPATAKTSADILQALLETKLAMKPADKDMVVMMHELEYVQNNRITEVKSTLIVKGEDNLRTAMAKTVGLPLGIAAVLILENKIGITGLHIPTREEIYKPVLKELSAQGISFSEQQRQKEAAC